MLFFYYVLRDLEIINITGFTVMDRRTSSKDSLSLLDPELGYREKLVGHLRFLSTLHAMVVR